MKVGSVEDILCLAGHFFSSLFNEPALVVPCLDLKLICSAMRRMSSSLFYHAIIS